MSEPQSHTKDLIDRSELMDLLYRLGAALDEKRSEDLRTVYTDEAVFEFSDNSQLGTLESAIDNAKKMGEHFARTQHVMTNPIIQLNGDAATVRTNLIATHVYQADRPAEHYDVGIVYHFESIRTAGGWRFSRVKLERVWTNGRWDAPQRD